MEVPHDPAFDVQRSRFGFCFTCETCSNFDPPSGSCVHGFPNAAHLLARYEASPRPATIVFCKDFDLA